MKCNKDHVEIIFDFTLTTECPLCNSNSLPDDIMYQIQLILDDFILSTEIEKACEKIEVLLP